MSSYEVKLDDFSRGKRLLRLPRPIRDRADASCDACGSSQPRTLYALKDLESERYYFVGDTCLKETVKRGAVLRRYGKEAGPHAFKNEIEQRSTEAEEQKRPSVPLGEPPSRTPEPMEPGADTGAAASTGAPFLFPVVLILETPEDYRVVISFGSTSGAIHGWGRAEEPRYQVAWRIGPENGLILEQVKEERPDALDLCLARAWQHALDRHQGSSPQWSADVESGPDPGAGGLPGRALAQLKLAAAALGTGPGSNGASNHYRWEAGDPLLGFLLV